MININLSCLIICFYFLQGLQISDDSKEKSILLKNRAAAYLKAGQYEDVIKDCTSGE